MKRPFGERSFLMHSACAFAKPSADCSPRHCLPRPLMQVVGEDLCERFPSRDFHSYVHPARDPMGQEKCDGCGDYPPRNALDDTPQVRLVLGLLRFFVRHAGLLPGFEAESQTQSTMMSSVYKKARPKACFRNYSGWKATAIWLRP